MILHYPTLKALAMADDHPTSESSSPSYASQVEDHKETDLLRELMLWRRTKLNSLILVGATAVWTAMEVYECTFITLLSYAAMILVVVVFLWGTMNRLMQKEGADLLEIEISEERAVRTANICRQWLEEWIRVVFDLGTERKWFAATGVIAGLYLVSEVARRVDFTTLCYIGVIGAMTLPVIYLKNEANIRKLGEQMRSKSQRFYSIAHDKLQMIKSKIPGGQHKEVKTKKMD